jgi:hypothetical protein
VPRRVVVVCLSVPRWAPPGVEPGAWRLALAEDAVDLLTGMAELDAAVAVTAADRGLAEAVLWPGMRVYEVPALTVGEVFRAAAADGYQEAALIAPDAPDVPAMLIGKLLRPLSTRPVAVAPASGPGLLGVAARLPVPSWLPDVDLDSDLPSVAGAAPRAALVASVQGWHRLTGPSEFGRLDPALEGWEATRALLLGHA